MLSLGRYGRDWAGRAGISRGLAARGERVRARWKDAENAIELRTAADRIEREAHESINNLDDELLERWEWREACG